MTTKSELKALERDAKAQKLRAQIARASTTPTTTTAAPTAPAPTAPTTPSAPDVTSLRALIEKLGRGTTTEQLEARRLYLANVDTLSSSAPAPTAPAAPSTGELDVDAIRAEIKRLASTGNGADAMHARMLALRHGAALLAGKGWTR